MCLMKYWKCLVIQVVWGVESRVGGKRASWNQGARASSPWVQGSSPAPRRARAWPASCPQRSLQGRELSWTERTLTSPSPRLWSPLSSRLVPTWGKPNGLFDGKLKGLSTLKSMLLEIRRSWYLPHPRGDCGLKALHGFVFVENVAGYQTGMKEHGRRWMV